MKKIFLSLSCCCLMFWACGHSHDAHHSHNHGHEHSHEHSHEHGSGSHAQKNHTDQIVMTPEKPTSAGVKVENAKADNFYEVITASGHLMAAANDESAVVANVAGIISMPRTITEGMKVNKGSVLFYISSDRLVNGDPTQKAQVEYNAAKEEYERGKRLLDEKLVTRTEFNEIKARFETARIAYEATAENKNGKGIAVKSPIDGYIRTCNVRPGDYVAIGDLLADVTRNNKLFLQAEIPLRYYDKLSLIESAKFATEYSSKVFNTKDLNGRLRSYGRTANGNAAFLPLTFEIDYHKDLVPGAFAEVHLICGIRNNVVSLPKEAITEEEGLFFIYIKEEEEHYSKREVKLGASDGERVEICTGLKAGEPVVTQGAIHVKLASISHSIPGHKH